MGKRFILSLMAVILMTQISFVASAHDNDNDANRDRWFKEMHAKKHEFLIKELELTPDQTEPFFAIYDKMDADIRAVGARTRALEKKAFDDANASEADVDAAIEAVYSQRYQEWSIENEAKAKFEKILTKKQLLKLKHAEFKFNRALMKQHNQNRRQPKK
ncbi:MAG: Spy/CpxP family protein refolding chaperone [Muribaculaceae bacterium]|nr:Spy/CpxP family protein refolding chaperone [Muribaculaceae bacterium]